MVWVVSSGEDEPGLDGKVDRQADKRGADEPQCPSLPVFAGAGQFSEHDGAGADLDQGVQTEAGEGD